MHRSPRSTSTTWLCALAAGALLCMAPPARARTEALTQTQTMPEILPREQAEPPSQLQSRAATRAPEVTAEVFYKWYMESLSTSADPLRDAPQHMAEFVSAGLMADLRQRQRRKGLRADYFIQAQNFREDWTTDIAVARPRIVGKWATVVVTLGATERSRRSLALTLAREGAAWKIRMVRLA